MRNILVLIHDDAGQESRLLAAVDLVRALGGRLTCLDVAVAPPPLIGFTDFELRSTAITMARAQESRNRAAIEPRLVASGISYQWIDVLGFIAESVCEAASPAELIVVSRKLDASYPDMREAAGAVLIDSGKPIVAMPETGRGFNVTGHALIAWDGSPAADKALQAAVPLLRLAGAVTLASLDDGSIRLPIGAAAAYLGRYDIRCDIRHERCRHGEAGPALLDMIATLDAAWLVMGGFGHSRLVEGVFGGVTRRMLGACPVPLFLAH